MKALTIAVVVLLFGCSGSGDAGNEAESSIAADLKKPIDKAAAVEQQIMEQKDRVDAALDDAEDGDPPRSH